MTDKFTLKRPVFRCSCDELLASKRAASEHMHGRDDPEDHSYTAVVECDRCSDDLGETVWVVVDDGMARVFCSRYCADFPETPEEAMANGGECTHPIEYRAMSADMITEHADGGDPPKRLEFAGYCRQCGAAVPVVYTLQRHKSERDPAINPDGEA